jgi:hypothetical protein
MACPQGSNKSVKTEPGTVDDPDPMMALRAKLKMCDLEVQNYVTALEAENFKCAKTVGQLQANNMALNNRIKAIIEKNEKEKGQMLAEFMFRAGERLGKANPKKAFQVDDKDK